MGRRKRHNSEQISEEGGRLLNAGQSVAHVCQSREISEVTCYCWRNQYGGMKCEEA